MSSENKHETARWLGFSRKARSGTSPTTRRENATGKAWAGTGKRQKPPSRRFAYRLSRHELIASKKIAFGVYKGEFFEYVKARQSEKTHLNYSIALGYLERYLNEQEGVADLGQIDVGVLDRFVSFRLGCASPRGEERTVERSTVNTELKAIKRFFNRAVELGYLRESPARKVKLLSLARSNPRFFGEGEASLILEDCDDVWARELHLFLLYTGLRIGEAQNLEWADLDFEARRIIARPKDFWKPKGREERVIPMHEAVYRLLLNKQRISRRLFTKQDGGKLNVHLLETKFRRQLTRLGIRDANLYTWRHTFASYLMMRTGNIRAVQKLLGHKSIRTTEIYSHLSERHLHHVVGQLPGPKMGTLLGTPVVLPGRGITQVVEW